MGVIIDNRQSLELPLADLVWAATRILALIDKEEWELSVVFCDDSFIAELNKDYLHRAGPTNVISFAQAEERNNCFNQEELLLGDVVISVETAKREVLTVDQSLPSYLVELMLHGVLHLIGYDHELGPVEEAEMEKERLNILTSLADRVKESD